MDKIGQLFFELISGARLYTTDVSTRILKKRPLLYLTMDILSIIFSFFSIIHRRGCAHSLKVSKSEEFPDDTIKKANV